MGEHETLLLTREQAEALLGELCTDLGYCLPTPAWTRIANCPPRTIDRFTDVVMTADGDDPALHKLRRQVQAVVERHFLAAASNSGT